MAFRHRRWEVGRNIGPLLILSCVAILLVTAAPAQATFPGDNGRIAFSSNRDGNYEIYTMNADGTGVARLTNDPGEDRTPSWSADGRKIAFQRDFEIWTMNADGTNQAVLSSDPGVAYGEDPSWSPDGRKIVFVRTDSSDNGVYVVNADGTGLTGPFGPQSRFDGMDPGWSPNGEKIVFAGGGGGITDPLIYTMNPDGTELHQLTNYDNGYVIDRWPNWAPDGTKIAFDRGADAPNSSGIITMDPDGGSLSIISPTGGIDPAWSPDKTRFAFAFPTDNYEIATMNVDGTNQVNITNNTANDLDPDWQALRPPGYARPKSATPTSYRLVPAYKPCTSSNGSHGAPLALPSCNPPQLASDYLTVGTSDSNGKQTNFTGLVTTHTLTEVPIDPTNGDQSDIEFTTQLSDIRQKQTLADYGGEVRVSFALRLTDRASGPGAVHPATVTDTTFGYSVPCATNTNAQIGSSCNSTTTADAVMPGIAPELKRVVWQIGQVQVYDGGPDALASTQTGNTLFMSQAVFVP